MAALEFRLHEDGKRLEVKCPHMRRFVSLPIGPEGWTITSADPLTVTPSIHSESCGCHGFITNGAWVAV